MADLVLAAFNIAELAVIGAGVAIAYKVARLTSRAPPGWVFLTTSFALGFVRGLLSLYAFVFATTMEPWTFAGQVITLPIVVFVLLGVSMLYNDFRRHLNQSQTTILAQQSQEQQ